MAEPIEMLFVNVHQVGLATIILLSIYI